MKKICSMCAYWEYRGDWIDYEHDEGFCFLRYIRTIAENECNEFLLTPELMEE